MDFVNCEDIQEFLRGKSDINSIESIQNFLSTENNTVLEHKSDVDLDNIEEESLDCIISSSAIVPVLYSKFKKSHNSELFTEYLSGAARILKENKLFVLSYDSDIIILSKNTGSARKINLQIIYHSNGQALEPFFKALDFIRPISDSNYIDYLISEGYKIKKNKDPGNDPGKHLKTFKKFLEKGKEFAPESWLEEMNYQFVEPNTFTMGHRIAYKIIDDFPDERFNSNFSLKKGDKEIILYLKKELPRI